MARSVSSGLTIDDSSFGMSVVGIEQYRTSLNFKVLNDTKEKLRDYDGIVSAISANWNGAAAQKFVNNLDASIEKACAALDDVWKAIDACIDAAKNSVIKQDNEMISDDDMAF